MKCENCGSELVGGSIVCRQCKHNNAQGRVSQWRARRTGELQSPTRTITPLPDAAKPADSGKLRNSGSLKSPTAELKPLETRRSNTIPFEPRTRIPQTPAPSRQLPLRDPATDDLESDPSNQPVWRAQLKDRVKQSRERKLTGFSAITNEPDEADLDPNPLVEAALKRIRWASHTPAATAAVRVARQSSQAAALAVEPSFEIETPAPAEVKAPPEIKAPPARIEAPAEIKAEPKPTARVTPQTNPLLARKPATQPVAAPEPKPARPSQPAGTAAVPPPPPPPAVRPAPPKAQVKPVTEARIEIPPAKPETMPVAESKPIAPVPRVTGELKVPAPPTPPTAAKQTATKPATEKNTPLPVQKPSETEAVQPAVSRPAAKSKAKDRPATMWLRTLAGACDFEVVAVAYLPLFGAYATLNPAATLNPGEGRDSLVIMILLLAMLVFCHQLLTLTLADRTSGMAFLNLRLVNLAGADKPVLFTQKFARAVAATAAFLCPPLNLLVMQSNQHRHSLPDLLSGTTLMEK